MILAGGRGSRFLTETTDKPKAMVKIGGRPILWHILKHFEHFGFRDFIVAGGYRSDVIAEYIESGIHKCRVEVADMPQDIGSGARLKRLGAMLSDGAFVVAFCDAVSTLNITELVELHVSRNSVATVAAVHPPPRFGLMRLESDRVVEFKEKGTDVRSWINGGYFVFDPAVLELIDGDEASLEHALLEPLAEQGRLHAFRHEGFWQCMDDASDKYRLDELLRAGQAPWTLWETQ